MDFADDAGGSEMKYITAIRWPDRYADPDGFYFFILAVIVLIVVSLYLLVKGE